MRIGIQTWGSDGDVRPFIALAGGLGAAGHEVTLAVSSVDNKEYSALADRLGFALRPVGRIEYDRATLQEIGRAITHSRLPLKQVEIVFERFFEPLVPAMDEAAAALCQENELVIGHFAVHPLATAARLADVPRVSVLNPCSTPSHHLTPFGCPDLGRWLNPMWWKLVGSVIDRSMGPSVNRLRQRHGLAPVTDVLDTIWASTDLDLLAVSPIFCSAQPDWCERHWLCGYFFLRESAEAGSLPDGLEDFLVAGPPPVYLTLGSMLALDPEPETVSRILIDAVHRAGCRAIVQSRWEEIAGLPEHPDIFRISNTPHHGIFPRCAAVVHHGGAGTTHSATRYGCPSVVVAHFGDQFFWGSQLRRLGLAPDVLPRRTLTAAGLSRAIAAVLADPEMKRRARRYGEMMRREIGVGRAVTLIEETFAE